SPAKAAPPTERQTAASEFAKLAAKTAAARDESKKAGGSRQLSPSAAKSLASDYRSFAKDFKLAEGFYNAGALYEEAANLKDAAEGYKDALQLNDKFGCAHAGLGGLAYRAGDVGRAQSEFDTALRMDPKCVQGYNGAALIAFDRARQGG